MLIPQPVAPENFRDGVPAADGSWVVECFAKAVSPNAQAGSLPSVDPMRLLLEGYITAWAVLPEDTIWLAAGSAFTWDTTGLAPAGLLPGAGGRGILTRLAALPTLTQPAQQGEVTITGLTEPFGVGGIGDLVRSELGDKIRVELQVAG
jgi:hypothetical protein